MAICSIREQAGGGCDWFPNDLAYCKYFRQSNVRFESHCTMMQARVRTCSFTRTLVRILLMFTLKWWHIPCANVFSQNRHIYIAHGCDHIFTSFTSIWYLFTVNKRNAQFIVICKNICMTYWCWLSMCLCLHLYLKSFWVISWKFRNKHHILRLRCTSLLPTIRILFIMSILFLSSLVLLSFCQRLDKLLHWHIPYAQIEI